MNLGEPISEQLESHCKWLETLAGKASIPPEEWKIIQRDLEDQATFIRAFIIRDVPKELPTAGDSFKHFAQMGSFPDRPDGFRRTPAAEEEDRFAGPRLNHDHPILRATDPKPPEAADRRDTDLLHHPTPEA